MATTGYSINRGCPRPQLIANESTSIATHYWPDSQEVKGDFRLVADIFNRCASGPSKRRVEDSSAALISSAVLHSKRDNLKSGWGGASRTRSLSSGILNDRLGTSWSEPRTVPQTLPSRPGETHGCRRVALYVWESVCLSPSSYFFYRR